MITSIAERQFMFFLKRKALVESIALSLSYDQCGEKPLLTTEIDDQQSHYKIDFS
jgi:hypothetical protein